MKRVIFLIVIVTMTFIGLFAKEEMRIKKGVVYILECLDERVILEYITFSDITKEQKISVAILADAINQCLETNLQKQGFVENTLVFKMPIDLKELTLSLEKEFQGSQESNIRFLLENSSRINFKLKYDTSLVSSIKFSYTLVIVEGGEVNGKINLLY
jgi:hypothetical protein